MKKKIINLFSIAFFIMLSFNLVLAQMDCSVPELENTSSPGYHSGSLYIKLYLHIIRNTDGSGGITNQELEETFDVIESIYSPHDIYFNICVDEIHDTDLMDGGNFHPYNNYDGINGYIKESFGGYVSTIPSKMFVTRNNPHNIAHELGHAIGLTHTFANGCYEDAPWYDSLGVFHYGSNADTIGDSVFDTPADVIDGTDSGTPSGSCNHNVGVDGNCMFINPDTLVDSYGHKYIDIEDPNNPESWYLANNIMSYFSGCHTLITPGQAERIRHQITKIDKVIQDSEKAMVFNYAKDNFEIKIYQPIIMDGDRVFDGDVRILSGGDLKINGRFFSFTPSHKIILNSGSRLLVEGTLIGVKKSESNCGGPYSGDTWGGIEFENVSGYSEQVVLNIVDANIRDADTAVKCSSLGPSSNAEIEIWESFFMNNHRAIDIYGNLNFFTIQNSEFVYTAPLHFSEHISHIKLSNTTVNINGLELYGPTSGASGPEFYGIESVNTNLKLRNSKIKGWKYGIHKFDYFRYLLFKALDSEIIDNYEYGIYSNYKSEQYEVDGCDLTGNSIYGIYLNNDQWSDIYISNNEFGSSQKGVHHYITKYYGYEGTFYYNNYFHDIDNTGIYFHNWYKEKETGALFTCNRMVNSTGHHIKTENAIDPFQTFGGDENNTVSSGNKYVSISGKNFDAIDLPTDFTVKYYWKAASEDPLNYTGISKLVAKNNARCAGNPYYGGSGVEDFGLDDYYDDWVEEVEKREEIEDSIDINIDDGDTTTIITIITTVTDSTAEYVADVLTELGPWLSDVSAEAFVENADMFTSVQIISVLSASPDVFMNSTVSQFAFGENSPLSPADQHVLQAAASITTVRTKWLIKLRDINMKINYIINQAIDRIVFDENGVIDYSNMRIWLSRKNTYSSDLAVANTFMSEGDYAGSISYLSGMSSNNNLSAKQINDINRHIELSQMLAIVYQDNRNESDLNLGEIMILVSIANSNTILAELTARAILEYYYGYEFEDEVELKGRYDKFKIPKKQNSTPPSSVSILPNPNDGQFAIMLQNNTNELSIKNVKIMTLTGKVVINSDYVGFKNKLRIQLENNSPGVYMYILEDVTGKLYKGKLLINK